MSLIILTMDLDTYHREGAQRARLRNIAELNDDPAAVKLRSRFERVNRHIDWLLRARRVRAALNRAALPLLVAGAMMIGACLAIVSG